jgi:multicomponent Na+:H+ antiporter subunit E
MSALHVRMSWTVIWLIALWILLWGDLSVGNVVSGVAVAVAVLAVSRLPRAAERDQRMQVRPLALAWFLLYVLDKLVEANLLLAWEILTPTNKINTGVVAVPLRTSSSAAMMVVANVITLTPGTMTIEAAGDPPVLYVNVLHLHDVERVRRDLLHLEELSVRAFGSASARAQLADRIDAPVPPPTTLATPASDLATAAEEGAAEEHADTADRDDDGRNAR